LPVSERDELASNRTIDPATNFDSVGTGSTKVRAMFLHLSLHWFWEPAKADRHNVLG
jgi:hypothetical protein